MLHPPRKTYDKAQAHLLHFVIDNVRYMPVQAAAIGAFIGVIVEPQVGWTAFLSWYFVVLIAYTVRAAMLRQGGAQIALVEQDPALWANKLFFWTVTVGLIAGSAPLLFFPRLPEFEQMALVMIFCCWMAGAIGHIGPYTKLYAVYICTFLLPVILAWWIKGSPHFASIASLLTIYGLVIFRFGASFSRRVYEGFEIRFRNDALVEELTAAQAAAEFANREKSRFLAMASHDLRQPLHALTIMTGVLERQVSTPEAESVVRQIGNSVSTLERQFTSILDLTRLEVGALRPDMQTVRVLPLFAPLEVEYQLKVLAKGLRIHFAIDDLILETDPPLFSRIVRNLIDNAVKFTDAGNVSVSCILNSDGDAAVRVADSGPGISPLDQERIFKEFYQAAVHRSHRNSGLGLGLAIVKSLAEVLDYQLVLKTDARTGTVFELVIPRRYVRKVLPDSGPAGTEAPAVDLTGYSVVLVEDEIEIHKAMTMLLTQWGCRLVCAASPMEAFRILDEKSEMPDAVLLDYSLGMEQTGLDGIEQFRQKYGPLPAAIITGNTDHESLDVLNRSEYPVLFKPLSPTDLRRLLEVFKAL